MIGTYLAIYVLLIGAVLNAQLDRLGGRLLAEPDPGNGSGEQQSTGEVQA
jgi:hypothetical protein